MSLAQRFERRLEGLVGGAFARVFKGQVEPVEIGSALQREAADKKNVMGNGQVMCPNRYRVTLASSDHDRLAPWEQQLTSSLAELVQDYLDENRWSSVGDIEVYLALDSELHTGVFGVASRMEPQAPPRRRPHDSLSMPAVAGPPAPQYGPPAPQYGPPGPSGPQQTPEQTPQPGSPAPQSQYAPPVPTPAAYAPPPPAPYAAPAPQHQQPYAPPQQAPQSQYAPQQSYAPTAQPSPGGGSAPAVVVDQTNQRFELRHGSNVVGRGTDADLQLMDQGISRRHLDIQFDGNFATAYDLGSTNGTAVNGHEVGSQVLRHGDVIRIGHTRLVYHQEHA